MAMKQYDVKVLHKSSTNKLKSLYLIKYAELLLSFEIVQLPMALQEETISVNAMLH